MKPMTITTTNDVRITDKNAVKRLCEVYLADNLNWDAIPKGDGAGVFSVNGLNIIDPFRLWSRKPTNAITEEFLEELSDYIAAGEMLWVHIVRFNACDHPLLFTTYTVEFHKVKNVDVFEHTRLRQISDIPKEKKRSTH